MKALLSKVVGGPDALVLEDVPSPQAKPGHAVISVKAIGVNFPDVLPNSNVFSIDGVGFQWDKLIVLSSDGNVSVSGRVAASNVTIATRMPGDQSL